MYEKIKEAFSKKFALWEILILDDELYLGNKRYVHTREWKLNWILQEDERGIYIEYYGIHRNGGHLHERIYANGIEESLDALRGYIVYSPNIPGDREESIQELEKYNKKIMKELKQKELL